MKTNYIFIAAILITNSLLFSQNSDTAIYKHNNKHKSYDKNKEQTAIFLSLKGGHHTINPGYESLNENWIADLSLGAVINKHWCLGVTFDYSTFTHHNYFDGDFLIYDRNYVEYGVSLFFKYKYYFMKDKININAGFGFGTYGFKVLNKDGFYDGDGYFNYGIRLGLGYNIIPNLSLDFEWSLYRLLIISENKKLQVINNFKIGPTIYLYY